MLHIQHSPSVNISSTISSSSRSGSNSPSISSSFESLNTMISYVLLHVSTWVLLPEAGTCIVSSACTRNWNMLSTSCSKQAWLSFACTASHKQSLAHASTIVDRSAYWTVSLLLARKSPVPRLVGNGFLVRRFCILGAKKTSVFLQDSPKPSFWLVGGVPPPTFLTPSWSRCPFKDNITSSAFYPFVPHSWNNVNKCKMSCASVTKPQLSCWDPQPTSLFLHKE